MEAGGFALVLFAFATGWLAERLIPWWARGLRLAAGPLAILGLAVATRALGLPAAYVVLGFIFTVAFAWSWAKTAAIEYLERHPR
jgi:uncharacterized membrane protein (DUF485 family)